jgi:hypothetical protein
VGRGAGGGQGAGGGKEDAGGSSGGRGASSSGGGGASRAPHLPTVTELREYIESQADAAEYSLEELTSVTAAVASQRLFNYLGWVTQDAFEQEENYFGVQSEFNDLMTVHMEAEGRARAEGREGHLPPPKEGEVLRAEMKRQEKAKRRLPCKTDDVIIVAMRPFHRQASPLSADELAERMEAEEAEVDRSGSSVF